MKKYNTFRVGISLIIVLVFLVGMGAITYYKALNIRNEFKSDCDREIDNKISYIRDYYNYYPTDRKAYQMKLYDHVKKHGIDQRDRMVTNNFPWFEKAIGQELVENTYFLDTPEVYAYKTYNELFFGDDIGFYSMVQKDNEEIVAESQNYLICYRRSKDYDDLGDLEDQKIIRLEDSFSNKMIHKMYKDVLQSNSTGGSFSINLKKDSIEGTYDDVFLYPQKLTLVNDIYENDSKTYDYFSDVDSKIGKKDISDWIGDDKLSIIGGNVTDVKDYNYKLNKEANEICNKLSNYSKVGSDKGSYQYVANLFTSYVGSSDQLWDDSSITFSYAFVFHPISNAIVQLIKVYLIILVILGASLYGVNKLIRKMRELQISYENNRKELTRSVAHELKTPLGIIKSYSESLKDISNEKKEEYTNVIINEVNHMDKLIIDMLDLSRMEAKAKTLTYEEVELVSLTTSILKRFDVVLKEQNLTLELDVPDEAIILADLEGMQTVLLNLISNAIKHAIDTIIVSITLDSKSVKFNIYNNGSHIVSRMLDTIWDTFVKGDKARGHQFGSTGLGLSITKNILELHKATYGVQNVENGVEFWFKIK